MSKVEEVARAISDNIAAGLPEGISLDYEYAARAAIEAMRDPTEAMRIAGDAKLCTCTGCDCDESLIYGAMISQALNEEG